MKRPVLLGYQWLTGLSDTATGLLLFVSPQLALRLMGVHAPADAEPYVAYIGAFVFSVGLACLYGARLARLREAPEKLEMIWLLTAFSRAAVAIYVTKAILFAALEPRWMTVALFDGACVVLQAIGLRKRWLYHVD